MLKVSFGTLWKITVLLLLAIIAFYSYRINIDLGGTYFAPARSGGCGIIYGAQTTGLQPRICVQPLQKPL